MTEFFEILKKKYIIQMSPSSLTSNGLTLLMLMIFKVRFVFDERTIVLEFMKIDDSSVTFNGI